MPRLIPKCPICHTKNILEKSHSTIGKNRFITLDCGHTYVEKLLSNGKLVSTTDDIILKDNRKLYPFQVLGVRFAEQSNFKCLIADEMGLGKTIQAIGMINGHYDDLKPIVIVVKSSLTHNWLRELLGGSGLLAQVFESGDNIIPGIGIVIVSFDTLIPRKIRKQEHQIDDSNLKKIIAFNPKTMILDEVQMLKNHNAKRTNAIREIARARIEQSNNTAPVLIKQQEKRIRTIAHDLMTYHDLDKRFKLTIHTLQPGVLGYTKVAAEKEGIIVGEICLSKHHVECDNENDIIETILHEIAHAITPGAGHRPIWKDTALAIGSNGQTFAWCEGTKSLDEVEDKTEPMIKYIVGLSGTPIKNNALEYFPILNLLRPEMFPSLNYFERCYVSQNGNSIKGLRYPKEFQDKTKDFIIRRERKEVMPELPSIVRDYKFYPLSDAVRKAYNAKVKQLDEFLRDSEDGKGGQFYTDLIAQLSILRHITGMAKLEPALEYISEFLENENNGEGPRKITIFHHHIDVGEILAIKLEELSKGSTIRITSADDSELRLEKIEQFKTDETKRILLIPTLAGGEGINLQFCDHAMILEREWNPANEEQAEGRFSRIGSVANSINVTYPTATGTIDEYFAEIVERKRQIVNETLSGSSDTTWDNSSIMLELANIVVKKWRM